MLFSPTATALPYPALTGLCLHCLLEGGLHLVIDRAGEDVEDCTNPSHNRLDHHVRSTSYLSDSRPPNKWFDPKELTNDLDSTSLLYDVKQSGIACAWQYVRCAIPHFTNRVRYLAFTRIILIASLSESRIDLIDVVDNDRDVL